MLVVKEGLEHVVENSSGQLSLCCGENLRNIRLQADVDTLIHKTTTM